MGVARAGAALVFSAALCRCVGVAGRPASPASSATNAAALALAPGGRPPRDQLLCKPGRNDGRIEPALPCRNGPFLMDSLAHYGEGIGGSVLARQQQLISLAHSLNTRYGASRIIVASRPHAYVRWTLPGFQAVTITAFEGGHRQRLATRLYNATGLNEEAAREKARDLNRQLRRVTPKLKDRPLFVTLMATIYLKGESEGLPTRPGALYRRSILLLLDRWTKDRRRMSCCCC